MVGASCVCVCVCVRVCVVCRAFGCRRAVCRAVHVANWTPLRISASNWMFIKDPISLCEKIQDEAALRIVRPRPDKRLKKRLLQLKRRLVALRYGVD